MRSGPPCFATRMYNSSFSQYLESRGSLAEYDTVSLWVQVLITTPRSSLAHLLAASERLSTLRFPYFLGWVSPERLQTLSNILCLLCCVRILLLSSRHAMVIPVCFCPRMGPSGPTLTLWLHHLSP